MVDFLIVLASMVASIGLIVGFVALSYRRMIGIRDGTQSRLETDSDIFPAVTPYIDAIRDENGLTFSKSMNFDQGLSSADKRAAELPDVNQTLQGKR